MKGTMGKRLERVLRWLTWLLVGLSVLIVLWYALDFVYVATDNVTDRAVPSDVIIVLGCPSYEGNVISVLCTQTKGNTPS